MQGDGMRLSVTVKTRLSKYGEGQAPDGAEPFETIEREYVLEGDEALEVLRQAGIDPSSIGKGGNELCR
ncbi:MAG: hypothetical protein RDU89_07050 [bacterium]|nr:hypothetical protein [bacterium]